MADDQLNPTDPPPHLVNGGAAVPRPMPVSPIHVRHHEECLAALVVRVNAEDPLGGVFTVDAVIFQAPSKIRDKFSKADTRPGSVRWANNMTHAEVSENKPLTWHYPGQGCLPPVVMEILSQQGQQ
jgi:hypothetical protein